MHCFTALPLLPHFMMLPKIAALSKAIFNLLYFVCVKINHCYDIFSVSWENGERHQQFVH